MFGTSTTKEIYAKNTLHFCFSITVPGAIAGWFDAYEKWGSGKVTFEEILTPAVQLAEEGFLFLNYQATPGEIVFLNY